MSEATRGGADALLQILPVCKWALDGGARAGESLGAPPHPSRLSLDGLNYPFQRGAAATGTRFVVELLQA